MPWNSGSACAAADTTFSYSARLGWVSAHWFKRCSKHVPLRRTTARLVLRQQLQAAAPAACDTTAARPGRALPARRGTVRGGVARDHSRHVRRRGVSRRSEQIDGEISEQQEKIFLELGEEASKEGIALLHTPAGFSLAPAKEGEVISPEDFERLPEEERTRIASKMAELQDKLQKAIRRVQQLQKEKRARHQAAQPRDEHVAVGTLTEEFKGKYAQLPDCPGLYRTRCTATCWRTSTSSGDPPNRKRTSWACPPAKPPSFRRYQVNL